MVYIKLYFDYIDSIEPLTYEERGRLFTAMLEYANSGQITVELGNEKYLFAHLKGQMNRDFAANEAKSAARKAAGKLGGIAKQANATFAKQNETVAANGSKTSKPSNNKDKDKDNIPPISPQGEGKQVDDPQFDSFWRLYPKKKAKEDARKAWNKLKPDGELYTAIMRSLSLQKKSPEWIKDNGQYAPYPATWLRGRRWEDEEPAAAAPKPEPAPLYEKVKPEIWRKRAAP